MPLPRGFFRHQQIGVWDCDSRDGTETSKKLKVLVYRWYLLLLLAAVFLSMKLAAQAAITGGLTGIVTDPSGAVLQNVNVEIKQSSKGAIQSTKTDRDGVYRFFFLAIRGLRPAKIDENHTESALAERIS